MTEARDLACFCASLVCASAWRGRHRGGRPTASRTRSLARRRAGRCPPPRACARRASGLARRPRARRRRPRSSVKRSGPARWRHGNEGHLLDLCGRHACRGRSAGADPGGGLLAAAAPGPAARRPGWLDEKTVAPFERDNLRLALRSLAGAGIAVRRSGRTARTS